MSEFLFRHRTSLRVASILSAATAASLSYAEVSGVGAMASIVVGSTSLAFTMASLATEFGVAGARARVHGSAVAVTGVVVAVLAARGGDGLVAAIGGCCACGGGGLVIGDALSGMRPYRSAFNLALSTSATVAGFLAAPIIAASVGG